MRLLFFLFVLFCSVGFATDSQWTVALLDKECEKVLVSFGRYRRLMEFADPGGDWPAERLVNTPEFQRWVVSQKGPTSTEIPSTFVVDYLDWFHKAIIEHPQALKAQKEKAMQEVLGTVGVGVKAHETSFDVLSRLSQKNLKRVVSKIPSQEYVDFETEIALVEKLRLVPSHNTSGPVGGFSSPLLSAKQMRRLGQVSLNQNLFNTELLKVEDHVFFYAYFGTQNQRTINLDKKAKQLYGENQGRLNHDFAEEHAWVSPFVMYAVDLVHIATQLKNSKGSLTLGSLTCEELRGFLQLHGLKEVKISYGHRSLVTLLMEYGVYLVSPEYQAMLEAFQLPQPNDLKSIHRLTESLENQLDENAAVLESVIYDDGENWQRLYLQSPQIWDKMLRLTHDYQFRVKDFETIVRRQLKSQLWKHKHSVIAHHHTLYQLALEALQKGNSHAIQVLLQAWVYEPLGIPREYEVKVPVAVDSSYLE